MSKQYWGCSDKMSEANFSPAETLLFTVRHFLLECGDFSHIRNKYFHVDTIKQLFNDVPIDNVFLFLKEINLFNIL